MAKPKFDYEGEVFYEQIVIFAMQGQTDDELAYSLGKKFGVDLSPGTFSAMKNGKYNNWTEEENKKRSEKIVECLVRGRKSINAVVRGRFLKAALGGIVVKGKTTTTRHMVVNGERTEDQIVETRETEQETPPNIQALSTWLYHFDDQWRYIQKGKKDEEDKGIPYDPKKGVSITKWIQKEIEESGEYEEDAE
jgi:hypothetical protein